MENHSLCHFCLRAGRYSILILKDGQVGHSLDAGVGDQRFYVLPQAILRLDLAYGDLTDYS